MKATTGEASFNGMNIRQALANGCARHSIGYCPQADALDFFLTPVEHLTIYAHLRGIPTQHVEKVRVCLFCFGLFMSNIFLCKHSL